MKSIFNGGLDTEQSAEELARGIFETYDKDKSGFIESSEVEQMMIDTYSSINMNFTPSSYDVETYIKVLDADGDGRISLQDIQVMVQRLTGKSDN